MDASHAKALHGPGRHIPRGIRSLQKVSDKVGKALLGYSLPDAPREALHVCDVVVGHQIGGKGQAPPYQVVQEGPRVVLARDARALGIQRPAPARCSDSHRDHGGDVGG